MAIVKRFFNKFINNDIKTSKNIDINDFDIFMDELTKKNDFDKIIKYNYTYYDNGEIFIIKKNMTMKIDQLFYRIRKNKREFNFDKFDYRITPKIITIKMYDIVYGVKTYIKYKIFI
jgi:hypothetical protein